MGPEARKMVASGAEERNDSAWRIGSDPHRDREGTGCLTLSSEWGAARKGATPDLIRRTQGDLREWRCG